MLLSRRVFLGLSAVVAVVGVRSVAAATDQSAAPPVISRFYDELLAVMKVAKRLPFDERYSRLAPSVSRTFDLPLMTRLSVGPSWVQIGPPQQQRLTAAVSSYTISEYAARFDDFAGERFEVAAGAPNANGVVVSTRLIKSNGEAIPLNYLMRQDASGAWKVIDVYLNGTISEMAARRSEFASVLQRSGADGLAQLIEQRTAALRTG